MRISKDWLRGFVDGEGCFFVGLNKNKTMRMGVQVLPEFVIVQHKRDIQLLYAIRKFFNCGIVRPNKSSNDDIMCYRVRKLSHLQEIIIPFFSKNSLLTSKRFDFLVFKKVLKLMEIDAHLTEDGLVGIKELKLKMNKGKDIVPSLLKK